MTTRELMTILALSLLGACSSDSSSGGGGLGGTTPDAAAGSGGGGGGSGSSSDNTASVTGHVTRSAQPSGDAKGNIYVALFDQDPIAHKDTAMSVGNALLSSADLSGTGASVMYSITGVPPRAEDYYAIAFLDDNGNVDQSNPSAAGPDKGDLVSLNGVSAPKLKVAEAGPHTQDLDLSLVMPF
jgi:hypothetical protein